MQRNEIIKSTKDVLGAVSSLVTVEIVTHSKTRSQIGTVRCNSQYTIHFSCPHYSHFHRICAALYAVSTG